MKHASMAAALLCLPALAQIPQGGGGGGGVGVGASNIRASIAGPATTSGAIDISALSLSTQALQNTLIAQCWTGTGFASSEVTGNLTPLTCSITSRSASSVTVTFASSSNVLVVINSNGGAGPAGATGSQGPAGEVTNAALTSALANRVIFTSSTSDPSGACSLVAIHANTATDTAFECVDGTWSIHGKFSKGSGAPSAGVCIAQNLGMLYVDTAATTAADTAYRCKKSGASTYAWVLDGAGLGDVTAASAFGTNNRAIASDGTGKGVKVTGVTIDGSSNVSGINNLTITGALTTPTAGAGFEGTPIANASVANPATTGDHRLFLDATNADAITTKKSDGTLARYAKTTDNVATATALAANGANCSAGQAAGGVNASGASEDCFTPSGGLDMSVDGFCFPLTNCELPIINDSGVIPGVVANRVYMQQVVIVGSLKVAKLYHRSAGSGSLAFAFYASSSGAPGAKIANTEGSATLGAGSPISVSTPATLTPGVYFFGWAISDVTSSHKLNSKGANENPAYTFLGATTPPRQLYCSNAAFGSPVMPATCGTATAIATYDAQTPALLITSN